LDLAVAQPFLAGGVEGWALALTSLRDLFGVHDTRPVPVINLDSPPPPPDPGQAGGDFSAEARRLGETMAGMHAALADAFGRSPGRADEWADNIAEQVRQLELPDGIDRAAAERKLDDLRGADPGPAIRVHGDLHLGQVMRTDAGWYVLDFEGEPARPVEDRRRPSSALRDVAGMLRSFHYASAVATLERDAQDQEVGAAWEARNRAAFLRGYMSEATKARVVPVDDRSVEALLTAFELEKAVYELGYERSYRPHWESIPVAALRRMVGQ
jgi:maltokinase